MQTDSQHGQRGVFCVLSARALPYAEKCFQSLFANAKESIHLTLVTDGESDKAELIAALARIAPAPNHDWVVHSQGDADSRAAVFFGGRPNLLAFRAGHPCWRKITDPMLFAPSGAEMVILDPDLYFPNKFAFEPTLQTGLQLMWQPRSCLLPQSVVRAAFDQKIRLAHHVDIGVAQVRNAVDLDWLEWLVGALGGSSMPRLMHIEAIVWAALAMRMGGGHLDPTHWNCYQYRQWKRLALRIGFSGETLLKVEPLRGAKCFHASGVSKWAVKGASERRQFPEPRDISGSRALVPYVELTERGYTAYESLKGVFRKLGYYKLMNSGN